MGFIKTLIFMLLIKTPVFLFGNILDGREPLQNVLSELVPFGEYPKVNGVWLGHFPNQKDALQYMVNHTVLHSKEEALNALFNKLKALKSPNEKKAQELAVPYDAVFTPWPASGEQKNQVSLVLFRGGRGGSDVTKLLADMQRTKGSVIKSLFIIVSGTDDGRSWEQGGQALGLTGVPDMGKALLDLSPYKDMVHTLSIRIGDLNNDHRVKIKQRLNKLLKSLDHHKVAERLNELSEGFFNFIDKESQKKLIGEAFKYEPIPLRTVMLVGAYARLKDWQKAIDYVAHLIGVDPRNRVMTATLERMHLSAITEDGKFLASEDAINETSRNLPIEHLFLSDKSPRSHEYATLKNIETKEEKLKFIRRHILHRQVLPNPEVIEALKTTQIVLYLPTTFESNLASSLAVPAIGQAISQSKAMKVFIPNAFKEADIGEYSGFDYFQRLIGFSRGGIGQSWKANASCDGQMLADYSLLRITGIGESSLSLALPPGHPAQWMSCQVHPIELQTGVQSGSIKEGLKFSGEDIVRSVFSLVKLREARSL